MGYHWSMPSHNSTEEAWGIHKSSQEDLTFAITLQTINDRLLCRDVGKITEHDGNVE